MVTIVDYGSGNLRSVQKSFERLGSEVLVTSDPGRISEADKLVLPGVGSFGDAMQALHTRQLVSPIKDFIQADRPFLGICIGLQLLFETGWEGGCNAGLGVLPGEVKRLNVPAGTKVPHMGWNTVSWQGDKEFLSRLKCDADGWFYLSIRMLFIHQTNQWLQRYQTIKDHFVLQFHEDGFLLHSFTQKKVRVLVCVSSSCFLKWCDTFVLFLLCIYELLIYGTLASY